jgi:hypothetical protein
MSEAQLPFIDEMAELISTKIEMREMIDDVDYILTALKEKIKENMDKDYSSESERSDSSESDEEDLIKEKIEINENDGFYEIKDLELEDCDRIGRSNKRKK